MRWAGITRVVSIAIVVVIFFLMVFVACAPRVTKGHVTGKRYVPAHEESRTRQKQIGQSCMPSGGGKNSPQVCTPIYWTEMYSVWIDDAWYVTISNGSDSSEWSVSREIYDSAVNEKYLDFGS